MFSFLKGRLFVVRLIILSLILSASVIGNSKKAFSAASSDIETADVVVDKNTTEIADTTGVNNNNANQTSNCTPINTYIKLGTKDKKNNSDVAKLQTFLKTVVSYDGKITGTAGPLTISYLKKYQKIIGVTQTGTAGPLTRKKINDSLCQGYESSTTNTVSSTRQPNVKIKSNTFTLTSLIASNASLPTTPSLTICALNPELWAIGKQYQLDLFKAQDTKIGTTTVPKRKNNIATFSFDAQTLANTKVFNQSTNDGYCMTYKDLVISPYVYTSLHSGTSSVLALYNDGWTKSVVGDKDFYLLNLVGNGGNADGVVYLSNLRKNRTIFIKPVVPKKK